MTDMKDHFSSRRRERARADSRRLFAALAVLALVILGAGAAWWFWLRSPSGNVDPRTGPPEADVPSETDLRDPAADVTSIDLPPVDESDAFVRDRLEELSSHPRVSSWLEVGELVHRIVTSISNVAVGRSPDEHVPFLRPDAPFRVREVEGRTLVDPASYRRYDAFTDAVLSVDTEGAGRLYAQLHPLFEELHRALGFTDRTFDETVARALGVLLMVEVPDEAPEVVFNGVVYQYRDPEMEALSPAEKHVLRLGPRNARRFQDKLRELADAMGVVPVRPDATP